MPIQCPDSVRAWDMALAVAGADGAIASTPPAREQGLDSLKADVEYLQSALQQATERIAELDAQAQK